MNELLHTIEETKGTHKAWELQYYSEDHEADF